MLRMIRDLLLFSRLNLLQDTIIRNTSRRRSGFFILVKNYNWRRFWSRLSVDDALSDCSCVRLSIQTKRKRWVRDRILYITTDGQYRCKHLVFYEAECSEILYLSYGERYVATTAASATQSSAHCRWLVQRNFRSINARGTAEVNDKNNIELKWLAEKGSILFGATNKGKHKKTLKRCVATHPLQELIFSSGKACSSSSLCPARKFSCLKSSSNLLIRMHTPASLMIWWRRSIDHFSHIAQRLPSKVA